jgi:hypothetical protein
MIARPIVWRAASLADNQPPTKIKNRSPHTMTEKSAAVKRSFEQQAAAAGGEEYYVDDLAIAAQFAMAQPEFVLPIIIPPTQQVDDDNEIDLASSSSSSSDGPPSPACQDGSVLIEVGKPDSADLTKEEEKKREKENNPDQDELAARRSAMEQMLGGLDSSDDDEEEEEQDQNALLMEEEEEAGGVVADSKKPLSKNEIDAYETSLAELQKRLDWNLEIGMIPLPAADDANSWAIAGHVRQHVVRERTLVILSEVGGTLLEEGTLLALRPHPHLVNPTAAFDAASHKKLPRLIPLGKILEVFEDGPAAAAASSPPDVDTGTASVVTTTEEDISMTDPWGSAGLFTRYLASSPNLPVYFLHRGTDVTTKLLDRAMVYKNSRRGCDASNLYDEEIDQHDMEYSDDEQERRAKSNRRGGGGNTRQRQQERDPPPRHMPMTNNATGHSNGNNSFFHNNNNSTIPQGFHRHGPPTPHAPFRSQQHPQQQQSPLGNTAFVPRQQQFITSPMPAPLAQTTAVPFANTTMPKPYDDDNDTEYYEFS